MQSQQVPQSNFPGMNRSSARQLLPMILLFFLMTIFFFSASGWLYKKGFDPEVLAIANILLFAVSLITFYITFNSLNSTNPHAFVRAMYGGFIIKFFVLAMAAFLYIMIEKKEVSKRALFAAMGLYVVYTVIEVRTLLRVLKQKKNA